LKRNQERKLKFQSLKGHERYSKRFISFWSSRNVFRRRLAGTDHYNV